MSTQPIIWQAAWSQMVDLWSTMRMSIAPTGKNMTNASPIIMPWALRYVGIKWRSWYITIADA